MKPWPVKPLGDVCLINPKLLASELPASNDEITFVPMAAVDEVSVSISAPELRRYHQVAKGYTPFKENDVLFAKITPCMQNGKAAIARDLRGGLGFGSTEFHVIRPLKDLLPEWVFGFIRQPAFKAAAEANLTGTGGQRRVPADFLKSIPIPVPPLGEQKRIVGLLKEADELRDLRTRAVRSAAGLLHALFQDMFGDAVTNSKGWPIHRAGELMEACDYGTSQKANESGLGIPVLRMGNVTTAGQLDLTHIKTVELSETELTKQQLKAGDVLFNRTNSRDLVGKTGMWDGRFDAVAASYFIRVRFRAEIEHPQHFTTFMNMPSMKQRLMETARGAVGQANINSKELKAIPVPVPPLGLQKEFATRATEIREIEAGQAAGGRRLDALFQSMLHRAFNGEL